MPIASPKPLDYCQAIAALLTREGIRKKDGTAFSKEDVFAYNAHGELRGLIEASLYLQACLDDGHFAPEVLAAIQANLAGTPTLIPDDETCGFGWDLAGLLWLTAKEG